MLFIDVSASHLGPGTDFQCRLSVSKSLSHALDTKLKRQ